MIRTQCERTWGFLIALAAVIGWANAEVTMDTQSSSFAIIAGVDAVDPSPVPSWQLIHKNAPQLSALNPTGDQNGDGPPAFAMNPSTGNPEVVWAWWDGHDHEIAYSRWSGTEWTVPEILTDNETEDTRPTIAVGADGARHISWWRSSSLDQVYYLWKPATGGTGPEEVVTRVAAGGTRPGIALGQGGPRVGYQEAQGGGLTLVVVAHKSVGGWEPDTLASTGYAGPHGDGDVDVQAHALGNHQWVDWISGPGQLGYATFDSASGTWSAPQFVPYSWNLAAGVSEQTGREFGRMSIRGLVLQP